MNSNAKNGQRFARDGKQYTAEIHLLEIMEVPVNIGIH